MEIKLKLHNLIFTIGPSGCGKTHFLKNELIPKLRSIDPNFKVQYISSDDIRRDLLDAPNMDKMDDTMLYPSDTAFELLHTKVDAYMAFPMSAEFVIVDTTGLSEQFYKKLIAQAQRNNYAITPFVFQYKSREDYMQYSVNTGVTSKHVKKLNKQVLPNITKRMFTDIVRVKELGVSIDNIVVLKHDLYRRCHLNNEADKNVIIGDVHGCYYEFIELLGKNGIKIDDGTIIDSDGKRIILVGDYIDKGSDEGVRKVVEFIHKNKEHFTIIYANHENYVYKRLKGQITGVVVDIESEHFNSVKLFQNDEELKEKFFELVKSSVPFVKHKHFFVTHAPCENKYIGKLDRNSLRAQRDLKYARRSDFKDEKDYIEARNKDFKFLMHKQDGGEAGHNHPFKIFGHVTTKNVYCKDNILAIDQGCYAGGRLTSVVINGFKSRFFQSVYNDTKPLSREIYPLIVDVDKWWEFNYSDCERKEASRIRFGARNKVNFISGTLSPSDKKGEMIECIDTAIEYYIEKAVDKLIIQPKYMGSRCQLYLFDDDNQCYGVTRNGYRIDKEHLDLTDLFPTVKEIPYVKNFFNDGGRLIILDGELMPWRALGKGMIDTLFKGIAGAVRSEQEKLDELGFYDVIGSYIENEYTDSKYEEIHHELSKKMLDNKLGGYRNRKTMEAVHRFRKWEMNKDVELNNLALYEEQIKLFGNEDKLHFKPFAILKTINSGGEEHIFDNKTNIEQYHTISSDNYLLCDLSNGIAYDRIGEFGGELMDTVKAFYGQITENEKMEGVVVKPERFEDGIAPMLKVRNPDYLTLVYGYDYKKPYKHKKLIARKSVRKKMALSVSEHETAMELLKIPYNEIEEDNPKYGFYYHKFIKEESKESEVDPRL